MCRRSAWGKHRADQGSPASTGGVCGGLESRCFPCIEKLRTTPTVSVWNCASATTGVKPSAGAGVDTVHSHTPRKVREDTERAAGHDGGPSFWPGQGAFSAPKSEKTTREVYRHHARVRDDPTLGHQPAQFQPQLQRFASHRRLAAARISSSLRPISSTRRLSSRRPWVEALSLCSQSRLGTLCSSGCGCWRSARASLMR